MTKKLEIIKKGFTMNCNPGTVWDAYEGDVWVGRIFKCGDSYHQSTDNKLFGSKESAARHCAEIHDNNMRALVRKSGVWDKKTHPEKKYKSSITKRERKNTR